MRPAVQLIDPPREIPPGLKLLVIASQEITGAFPFLVVAVVFVILSFGSPTPPRLGFISIAALLLLLSLAGALPAVKRIKQALDAMKHGFMTTGRVVSCRLAWDEDQPDMRYAEFLPNWALEVAKSQVRKGQGSFISFLKTGFVVSFVLLFISFAIALLTGWDRTARLFAALMFMLFLSGIAAAVVLSFLYRKPRLYVDQVEGFMQWKKLVHPLPGDEYNEEAVRLVEKAKKEGVDLSIQEPLPKDYSLLELICQAQYSLRGEHRVGEGRVRMCDRLDSEGVELLLFDPARPANVIFMAGLPPEVSVDALGHWQEVAASRAKTGLIRVGVLAAAIFLGIALQVPWILGLPFAP